MEEKNQKVIVRADRAGVFYGVIVESEPLGDKLKVRMKDVRRLWYWNGAASLSQLATEGVTKPDDCKFTVTVESETIVGVIEILPCTPKAIKSIESVKVWKQ